MASGDLASASDGYQIEANKKKVLALARNGKSLALSSKVAFLEKGGK